MNDLWQAIHYLRVSGKVTKEECGNLLKKLSEHNKHIKENVIAELQSKSEEVCEWKYVDTVSFNAKFSCDGKIRNIKSMRSYKYCPYCGRKIKVVE